MADEELSRWLADHALAVAPPGTEEATADLAPLRGSLGEARLIGIGEAVVGTRELVLLTHRLLDLLVAGPGLRTLALGAPEAATTVVDGAVRGERADPATALEGMADWRWCTSDVQAVVEWLARHNAGRDPGERVRLVGTDPVSPAPAVKAAGRHLREADPPLLEAAGPSLQRLIAHRPGDAALPAEVGADAARVGERLAGAPGALARHGRAIARAAELAVAAPDERDAVRARLVAEAVEEAVGERTDGAVVWWAHARDVRVRVDDGVPSVGARLREHYGRGYYALALMIGEGEFRARRRRRVRGASRNPVLHTLPAPPPGTLEAAFGTGTGVRVVDLRGDADREGTPDWVSSPIAMRVLADPTPMGWKHAVETVTLGELDGLAHVARARQAAVR